MLFFLNNDHASETSRSDNIEKRRIGLVRTFWQLYKRSG